MRRMLRTIFRPASLDVFKRYSAADLLHDATAGLVVGVLSISLAIAFGIASGVSPAQGLMTAVVAGFLISALGGSSVQIGGPTGAFIVIVYGIVAKHGYNGLAIATLMAGVILVLMGVFRLGVVVKYIPFPVIIGFTTGIAIVILAGQFRDMLGLRMESVPADFADKFVAYAKAIHTVNPVAVVVCACTIGIILACKRRYPKVPGTLVAILAVTGVVTLLRAFGVAFELETIGSRFPSLSEGMTFPAPTLPTLEWTTLQELFAPAISIALLAAIESLLSAVIADGMTGKQHHANTELIAQGVANIASPIFGGIPATGAIVRTATNIKTGGRTPVAGMIHAVVVLLVMLFFGKYAALIPMAVLGGIVAVVAWNMAEFHVFRGLFRSTKSDAATLVTTFLLTVFVDLTVAIQLGVTLAVVLFVKRTAETGRAEYVTAEGDEDDPDATSRYAIPAGCEVFEISGPLFFGAVDKFRAALNLAEVKSRVLVVRMRHVHSLDATALRALDEVLWHCRKHNMRLILSGVQTQPRAVMATSGFMERIGLDNVCVSFKYALAEARAFSYGDQC